MVGDIQFMLESGCGYPGDVKQTVLAGAVGSILAGEPVTKALGQQYVLPAATGTPVVGTDFMGGISATLSTDTVAADGLVSVSALVPGVIYLIKPLTPATYGQGAVQSQSLYNGRIGTRVLFDLTAGVYTIGDTDGATNGLVVEYLDVTKYPGLVAFSIREGAMYTA